jgi:DNA primase catalytic subunit
MEFSPQILAVDIGSKTKINKFPEKKVLLIMLPPGLTPEEIKNKFIHYLPEGAYYDRNIYKNAVEFYERKNFMKFWTDENYAGQEFCFDVDAENISKASPENTEEYTKVLKEAAQKSLELAEALRQQHGFNRISFVYSGRGFHVKIHDKDTETFSFKERTAINDTVDQFPIDRWVSGGHSKLMRLPFSLHGVVSRIATILRESEMDSFDPSTDERVIPKFLKEQSF